MSMDAKATRAVQSCMTRRFASVWTDLTIRRIHDSMFSCVDNRTGSWIEFTFAWSGRLRVLAEYDATNPPEPLQAIND
jgi:hypothetical protein